jgi:hypothetical protein
VISLEKKDPILRTVQTGGGGGGDFAILTEPNGAIGCPQRYKVHPTWQWKRNSSKITKIYCIDRTWFQTKPFSCNIRTRLCKQEMNTNCSEINRDKNYLWKKRVIVSLGLL